MGVRAWGQGGGSGRGVRVELKVGYMRPQSGGCRQGSENKSWLLAKRISGKGTLKDREFKIFFNCTKSAKKIFEQEFQISCN